MNLESSLPSQQPAELIPALYADLHRLAHRERMRVGSSSTLQTTALINEAYLKLRAHGWTDSQHFMRVAASTMRQVLIDAARARLSEKRGNGIAPLPLEEAYAVSAGTASDDVVVSVGDAVKTLASLSPRLAQIVECRFFAGYSDEQTAQALGVGLRTIERDWAKARTWLYQELCTG